MIRRIICEAGPSYITGLSSLCVPAAPLPVLSSSQTLNLLFWHMSSNVVERSVHYVYGCLDDDIRRFLQWAYSGDILLLSETGTLLAHCVLIGFIAYCSRQRGLAITSLLRQQTSIRNLLLVEQLIKTVEPQQLIKFTSVETRARSGGVLHLNSCFTLSGRIVPPAHPEDLPSTLAEYYASRSDGTGSSVGQESHHK